MTIDQLRNKIISEGIKGAKNDPQLKENQKIGSIEGFEMCKDIDIHSPAEFEKLLNNQRNEGMKEFDMAHQEIISTEDYWKFRYRTIQIEYVYEILKYAWIQMGFEFHFTSARVGLRYNELMQKYSSCL